MDNSAFFLKACRDFRLTQSEDGSFPHIAPNALLLGQGSPAWADAGISVPCTGYVHFANRRLLEENYTAGCSWVDGLRERSPKLISTNKGGFGDWLNGDKVQVEGYPEKCAAVPNVLFNTANFASAAETLAKMARVLGRTDDEKKYAELPALQTVHAAIEFT